MDTVAQGWEQFERVNQTGKQTGNDEEENYVESHCQIRGSSMFLVLSNEHGQWTSGKIRSKRNLVEMAPNGGTLEIVVQGPNPEFHDGRKCRFARSLWPAVWLLGQGKWPQCGEIDLFEQMQFKYDDCNKGFSTAHFGDRKDYVFPGHWGLHLGSYVWYAGDHLIKFTWKRREDGVWELAQWIDDRHIWAFVTKREGLLAVGHEAGDGFGEGQPGDPAAIFQRAFDDPRHGLHVIVNLAKGGHPFGKDSDASLKNADFVVKGIRVH